MGFFLFFHRQNTGTQSHILKSQWQILFPSIWEIERPAFSLFVYQEHVPEEIFYAAHAFL